MNKPVFDKVTGEAINVGDMIVETLPGDSKRAETAKSVLDMIDETLPGDTERAEAAKSALDFLADELDGRRSIIATDAASTSSEYAPVSDVKNELDGRRSVVVDAAAASSDQVPASDVPASKLSPSAVEEVSKTVVADASPSMVSGAGSSVSDSSKQSFAPSSFGADTSTMGTETAVTGSMITPLATFPVSVVPGSDSDTVGDFFDMRELTEYRFRFTLLGGNDTAYGSRNDDTFEGGEGHDYFAGFNGDDWFYGGNGFDTVDYSVEEGRVGTLGGVFINLSTQDLWITWNGTVARPLSGWGGVVGRFGDRDFLSGIEAVKGTRYSDVFHADNALDSYQFEGLDGDDDFYGGSGDDTLVGGNGSDFIRGGKGNDKLYSNNFANHTDSNVDQLYGGEGDDTIYAGDFDDIAVGGKGNDWIYAQRFIYGDTYENDYAWNIDLQTRRATRADGQEVDTFAGSFSQYYVLGSRNSDTIRGSAGNDTLDGGAGYDLFIGSEGSDRIDGGVNGATEGAAVNYQALISGGVTIDLRLQHVWKASGGQDTLINIWNAFGTDTNDYIYGSDLSNTLYGNNGNDVMAGAGGNDYIYGGDGLDKISGDDGNDVIDGGKDYDTIIGSTGNDIVDGGVDGAEITYELLSAGIVLKLNGAGGGSAQKGSNGTDTLANIQNVTGTNYIDRLEGDSGRNILKGAGGNDQIYGMDGNDVLYGGAGTATGQGTGDDKLYGGANHDRLYGEDGNDILDGGTGADTMVGGEGNDIFYVDSLGDFTIELANEGTNDFAWIGVKNYDARKLDNIENWAPVAGTDGSLNYIALAPEQDTIIGSSIGALGWVNEGAQTASAVAAIWAADDGNGGQLNYYLGNIFGGLFEIRHVGQGVNAPNKGPSSADYVSPNRYAQIWITRPADFEAMVASQPDNTGSYIRVDATTGKKYYVLTIHAEEQDVADGGLVSTNVGTIEIEIRNIDDTAPSAPVFNSGPSIYLPENTTFAAQLFADDVDTPSSNLKYFFDYSYGLAADGNGKFAIDSHGRVVLADRNSPLDYESLDNHEIKIYVRAYDGARYGATRVLTIHVTDTNDRPDAPLFNGAAISFSTPENQTFSVQLTAKDEDRPPNSMTFRFDPNNPNANWNGLFAIDASGKLVLADPNVRLDFETMPVGGYKVYIQANDGTGQPNSYSEVRELTIFATDGRDVPLAPKWDLGNNVTSTLITVDEGTVALPYLIKATDPDGQQQDVRYAFVAHAGSYNNYFDIDSRTGQVTAKPGFSLIAQQTPIIELYVQATDTDGQSQVQRLTIYVRDATDDAPIVTMVDDGIIAENQSGNTYAFIEAEDPEGFPITFEWASDVSQRIKDLFILDAGSGAISVRTTLDYEAQDGVIIRENGQTYYELHIVAREQGNGQPSLPATVRIHVTDANDAPVLSTPENTVSVNEFARNGDVVATFTLTDQDANEHFVYEISGLLPGMEGAFGVDSSDPSNLKIVVLDRTKLAVSDFTSMVLTLTVKDHNGGPGHRTDELNFFVTIMNDQGDLPPSMIQLDGGITGWAAEDLGVRGVVGTLSAQDENPAGLTFTFVGGFDGAGHFEIDPATHQVKVKTALNFEDPVVTDPRLGLQQDSGGKFYLLKVQASDGVNAPIVQAIKVYVTDVNERPTAPTPATLTLAENITAGNGDALLLTVSGSTDPDGTTPSYAFATGGNPTGKFSIAANGEIALIDGETLDYEDIRLETDNTGPVPRKYYKLLVVATDGSLSSDPSEVRIYITNEDEAPNAPIYTGEPTVAENLDAATVGTIVTVSGSTDPEGAGVTYALSTAADANPGNRFVVGTDGTISLAAGVRLDYEATDLNTEGTGVNFRKFYYVKVVATDGSNVSTVTWVKIFVTNVNEAPTVPTPANVELAENTTGASGGTLLLTVSGSSDPDGTTPSYVFATGGNPTGKFAISANGDISLIGGETLDYEGLGLDTDNSGPVPRKYYKLMVVATDGSLSSTPTEVRIYVTDQNEVPVFQRMTGGQITETYHAGQEVGTLLGYDPEDGLAVSYTFANGTLISSDGAFRIVGDKIVVNDESAIQVLSGTASPQYQIVIHDQHGMSSPGSITIDISDVPGNQPPSQPSYSGTPTLAENVETTDVLVQLSGAVDPEGQGVSYAFAAAGNPDGLFAISNDGKITLAAGKSLNYEAEGLNTDSTGTYYSVLVVAKDPAGNASTATEVRIYVTDANDAPTLSAPNTTVSIGEFSQNDDVLTAFTVADPDANEHFLFDLTYSLDWAMGAFRVDASDPTRLKIVVADKDKLEIDQNETFTLTLTVRDKNGGPDSMVDTITFTVTILNDQGNLPPHDIMLDNITVPEGSDPGDVVGTLSATDERPDLLTYNFVTGWDGAGHFEIDHTTNQIKVMAALNYEDQVVTMPGTGLEDDGAGNRFYRLKVLVSDGANPAVEQEFLVFVTDKNEAPTATYTPVDGIVVGTLPDTVVANIMINDPDVRQEFRDFHYQLVTDLSGNTVYTGTDFRVDENGNIVVDGALTTGSKTLYVKITDSTGADANTIVQQVTFTVGEGNIAPEIIVNGDTDWTIPDTATEQPFQNLAFEDDDAGTGDDITVTITFDRSHGTLTSVLGQAGRDYFYDPVNPNKFIVTGSILLVNQIVQHLTFNPNDQFEGSADRTTDFSVQVTDVHGATSQPQMVTVIDTPNNQAPTLTIQDNQEHFVIQDNGQGSAGVVNPFTGLELGDNENDELTLQVKFHAANGSLGNVDSIPNFVAVSHGDPDAQGDVTYTFVGTKAALAAFLAAVTFDAFNDSAAGGLVTTTFTFALTDNLHAVVIPTESVTVVTESSTNGRPVLFIDNDTRTTNATDDGLAVYPFRGVDISDAEDDDLVLTITFLGTADQLQGTGAVTGTSNPDGTVTFRFVGKAVSLDAVLHQLTFNPQNGSADAGAVDTVFKIQLSDALHVPVSDQVIVHTQDGDDSNNMEPVIDIFPGTETTPAWSNGPAVFPFRGVDISDEDDDLLTLTISFEVNEGTLSGAGLPTTWTEMGGIRTYVLTGRADDLDAILRRLAFDPRNDAPNETRFTISVQDSTHGPVTRQVIVQTAEGGNGLTNDEPTIEFAPGTETTPATDNGSAVYLFRGVDISDNEDDQLILTIRFSDAAGQLSGFGSRQIITSLVDGIRTYIVMDTADNLDAFLHGLFFDPNPLAQDVNSLDTIFEISVQDTTNPPVPAQVTVHTTHGTDGAGNAQPTATFMEGTQVTAATDDGLAVLPFRGLDLTDADGDNLTVKITFDGRLGSLTGYDPTQVHVTTSGAIITLTFTGTADVLDGVLQALSYDPAQDAIGATVFTISVQDVYHDPFITSATVNTTDGGSTGDVNHAPAAPTWDDSSALKTIDETAAVGSPVGNLNVQDPDGDAVVVGFWYENALHAVSQDNRFWIDSGVVKVLNAAVDDDIPDLPYLVRAVDSHGAFTDSTIHIAITGENAAPEVDGVNLGTGPAVTTISFDESLQAGGFVAQIVARDDGNPNDLVYFMNDPSHLFDIDQDTGQITLRDGVDYETLADHSWTVTVWAKDRNGQANGLESTHVNITIDLHDVNEAPTAVNVGTLATVRVGAHLGDLVTTVSAVDQDTNPTYQNNVFKFLLSNGTLSDESEDHFFTIDAFGNVKLKADVAAEGTHTFKVVTYMAGDEAHFVQSAEQTVTVLPDDTDPGPLPAQLLDNRTVVEHAQDGSAVGRLMTLSSTGETFSYAMMAGQDADGRFELVGSVLRVKDGLRIDFEQGREFHVKMLVTSSLHGTFEQDFLITARNLDLEVVDGDDRGNMIVSGNDSDQLNGWGGNDTLISGLGDDQLTGGDGDDTFVFDQVTFDHFSDVDNVRYITDFDVNHDHIDLWQSAFDTLDLGALTDLSFHSGSLATMNENSRIIYDTETGDLFYDIDGSGSDFESIRIATLLDDPTNPGFKPHLLASHISVVEALW
ncbi:cadherin domain-containing protein [Microvirga sp. 2MCAF38]|uniref:cadherin domain-containing protein n=1 Tax=Microvirga sp. 2MCAF38 TaxID=3232989 RepID=UPI003F979B4C